MTNNEYFNFVNNSTLIENLNQCKVILKGTPTLKNKIEIIANMKDIQYNTSNYMNPRRLKK